MSNSRGVRYWIFLAVAFVLLNASLTFQNVWPTPAVKWVGDLSLELAAVALVLSILVPTVGVSRRSQNALAALWVVLVIGRYAEVTAPAVYGRPINLYWDARHLSNVAAMLVRPASWWIVLAAIVALIGIPALIYWPLRWALRRLVTAMRDAPPRAAVQLVSVGMLALYFVAPRTDDPPGVVWYPAPVTQTYGRQLRLLAWELTGSGRTAIPPSPHWTSTRYDLSGVDVLVVFVESYGAVSYDRPGFAHALAASRAALAHDIEASGRRVVSAYVESPTFGGSSWLAHISLLSGIEVRDEDTNTVLMTQQRDTMVSVFKRAGYRTVAVMPGLQTTWSEGVFYRFDDIYNEIRLDYRGPQFGWWSIPDQFTLARIDEREVAPRERSPLFLVFPTISTHTPFSPIAPYQPDWSRMLGPLPYDAGQIDEAFAQEPNWIDFGPSYVRALAYDYASIGGYLRLRADRDFVMVLIGDHQPPAAVSGERAPWDVPMHVIASRPEVLDTLIGRGFRPGLQPLRPAIGRMHQLGPLLLDAITKR